MLREALRRHSRLSACVDTLRSSGLLPTHLQERVISLCQGTWIFLDPEEVGPALEELETGVMHGGKLLFPSDLRIWHIIASPDYFQKVQAIIEEVNKRVRWNTICNIVEVRIIPGKGVTITAETEKAVAAVASEADAAEAREAVADAAYAVPHTAAEGINKNERKKKKKSEAKEAVAAVAEKHAAARMHAYLAARHAAAASMHERRATLSAFNCLAASMHAHTAAAHAEAAASMHAAAALQSRGLQLD